MIVDKHISIFRLLKIIWKRLALMALIGFVGAICVINWGGKDVNISMTTPSILGTALSIFLGFRTNSAFERWMRARRLWGEIGAASMNMGLVLARVDGEEYTNFETGKVSALAAKVMPRMIRRNIAWVWALNYQLKDLPPLQGLDAFLEADEYEQLKTAHNPAMKLLYNQSRDFRIAGREHQFMDGEHFEIVGMMKTMVVTQNMCEGLKNTPFPTHYTFFTDVFIWLLVVLLAFSLPAVESIGYFSIFAIVLIGWVFSMIDGIGTYMQDPFVNNRNVVPMSALARLVERNLRGTALGEKHIPPKIEPVEGALY